MGDARDRGGAYRDSSRTAFRILVRNPPVLSAFAVLVGFVINALAAGAIIIDGVRDLPLAFRGIAVMVVGLFVMTAALSALRPHTKLAIEGDRLVVERAKHARGLRAPLLDIDRVEHDPITGDVSAITASGPVLLASGLLPEQASLVRDALTRALAPRR